MDCCKDRFNMIDIEGSLIYDKDGYLQEKKMRCKVCERTETWVYDKDVNDLVKIQRYYVDTRTMEVVHAEDLDINRLTPELYYEYRCGTMEGIIIEKWCVGDDKYLDFAVPIEDPYKDEKRASHFKLNKVEPLYLKAYTVPPSWFKEQIEKHGGVNYDK